MPEVKSFEIGIELQKQKQKLDSLDGLVNRFLTRNNIKKVIPVSHAAITDDKGVTIGLMRVVCYED